MSLGLARFTKHIAFTAQLQTSFLLKAALTFLSARVPHFVCSSADGCLGCFCPLAVVNSGCANISLRLCFQFFQVYSQKWAESHGISVFNFLRPTIQSPTAEPLSFFHQQCTRVPVFSLVVFGFFLFLFFNGSY